MHISTPEIYGSTKGVISEDEKFNPTTPYAISRVNADFFLRTHWHSLGPNISGSNTVRTYEKPVSINKTVFPSIDLEQAQSNQSGGRGRS